MVGRIAAASVSACLVILAGAWAGDPAGRSPQEEPPPKFVGAQTCRNCHRTEEKGNQFGVWEQSKHAHALEAFATDQAREYAAARNIENPAEADACVRCHVTGFGLPAERFSRGFRREAGVQCETCHGPGDRHVRTRMANASNRDPIPYGTLSDEISMPTEETCRGCHNEESPAYREFNFNERVRQIRHLDPTRQGHPPELENPPEEDEGGGDN